MRPVEIAWNLGLGLVVLIVGAVLRPLFKRFWIWMRQPSPLTPQLKGQLTTQLATTEESLERLAYLGDNPKDLFLLLIQLLFAALLCFVSAAIVFLFIAYPIEANRVHLRLIVPFPFLVLAAIFCAVGISEGSKLSDKRINKAKQKLSQEAVRIKNALLKSNDA